MEILSVYHDEIPDFLRKAAGTEPILRLRNVGMNCGCEYTAFPCFSRLKPYSRYDHSLGVALIVWHFTEDRAQALSGLFHDIATPVFAHVIDFMHGDHIRQESTESETREIIESDPEIIKILKQLDLTVDDVSDYHIYPVADNDSPRLSADRLEYTLGNILNFGLGTEEDLKIFYEDLVLSENEDGISELSFRTEDIAVRFARLSIKCGEVYVYDEDRYAMQRLSELIKEAIERKIITEKDLYTDETSVIGRLLRNPDTAAGWRHFRCMNRVVTAGHPEGNGEWREIPAKRRYIDPWVVNSGRVSLLSEEYRRERDDFLCRSQDYYIREA